MSLDKIISLFLLGNYFENPTAEDNIQEKDLVQRDFKYTPQSRGLYVFIPPWHRDVLLSKIMERKIVKIGFSALFYSFSPKILSASDVLTVRYFEKIKNIIKNDITTLRGKHNFSEINIISFSIGAVIAMMVADNNDRINKLELIVPGSNLAESMWNGIRTQRIRAEFEKKNITLGQLNRKWEVLAPKDHISGLKCKKIYIQLSRADKIIPYVYGKELADLLKKSNIKTVVEENNFLGHYCTCLKFYLFPKLIV